ncbi:MAG TPA: Holliday junction resolvase RuvX [Candidatus Acidoferrales bacterium]|nr:Holliday junction resolvase RuvX [Candidatus Acidoferrales bacterium]
MIEDVMMSAGARIGEIPEAAKGETARGRVLAIDYGRKRIGLALSDELGMTSQPFAILVRTNRQGDIRRLRAICRANGVTQIVVGHPVHMSGEAGEMADEAVRFAARLTKELGIKVDLMDERLTSWEAQQMASEFLAGSRKKRGHLDDVAAAILLREYLGAKRLLTSSSTKKRS